MLAGQKYFFCRLSIGPRSLYFAKRTHFYRVTAVTGIYIATDKYAADTTPALCKTATYFWTCVDENATVCWTVELMIANDYCPFTVGIPSHLLLNYLYASVH